jgi:hypothetical protein
VPHPGFEPGPLPPEGSASASWARRALERTTGIEPATSTLATLRATSCATSAWSPLAGLNRRPSSYQGDALPTELNSRGWPPKTRTWTFLLQRQAGCRLPHRPSEPSPGADPGHSPEKGEVTAVCDGIRALGGSRTRNIQALDLASLPVGVRARGAATRCRPGSPALRGRGRSRAQRLGWDTRLRTWILRVQGPAGLPVPPYPIGAGGGSRTRTSSCSPSFELGAAAYYATPACAARESNPVSPIKSRVLHRYSPRRAEPHAGIKPAFLAWKASTLAIVLVRRGDSGWDRTSGLLGFNRALVPTELQSHQSGWQDSNLRFPDPKSGALPSWTTSRRRRDSRT